MGTLSALISHPIFVSAFLPKLPNQETRNPSEWIILDQPQGKETP